MIFIRWRLTLLLAGGLAVPAMAETALKNTRGTLEKWVETRQLISKTRADWQSDKELLQQTIELFNREIKATEEQFAKLDTNSTQVSRERTQAETQLKSANDSLAKAREFAADFEVKIGKLVPQLPVPLQEILKPLLNRIPTDPANTRMMPAERVQVIVGILNELDKFNNAVSLFTEKRKSQKGEEIAVETVYIGLGAAYFVNDADDFAGMGTSGPNGWQWTIQPALAAHVREVIRIYRNERPARFVSLPARIQ